MHQERNELLERLGKVRKFAFNYGQIDGNHHKMWVIDQMVRASFESKEEYDKWVELYELDDETLRKEYTWDIGVAP